MNTRARWFRNWIKNKPSVLLLWALCYSPLSLAKPLALDFSAGQAEVNAQSQRSAEQRLTQQLPGRQTIQLSLQDAILLALRYSPDIQSAQLQRIVDKYNLALARYAFDVQYNVSASSTMNKDEGGVRTNTTTLTPSASVFTPLGTEVRVSQNNDYANGAGTDASWSPNISLDVSQPLISGFGTEYNEISLENAIDNERINRLNMRDSISSAVQAVISTYRNLILANNNLETNQASLAADQRTVAEDKALIEAGRKAPTDVANAEAAVGLDLLNIASQKNVISQNVQDLVNSIGLRPGTQILVPSDVEVEFIPVPDVQASIDLALQNSRTYQNGITQLQQLERSLYQAQQDALPNLDLNLTTTYGNPGVDHTHFSSLGTLATFQNSVGLSFSYDIDDFNDYAAIQTAKVAIQQQKLTNLQTRESIEITIINDINNIINFQETVKQSENNLRLQQKAQDFLVAKGKFGLASTFDITEGQENVNSARQQVISNKISYLNALTAYYADMGVLLERWNIDLKY